MLRLSKLHGLGNDFLVALEAANPGLSPDAALARDLCHRHTGVGADGLIFGMYNEEVDLEMVLVNSDGSPAEISGNGIRCLVHALLRSGLDSRELTIRTPGGDRAVSVLGGDPAARMEIEVDMGAARPGPSPTAATLDWASGRATTVDLGNPHLVLEVEDPDQVELGVQGPCLESGYPEGINVHFVAAREGALDLRVWERGAGVTEACGSGAVAAAFAASSWGLAELPVEVRMPGGSAVVAESGAGLSLRGPSVFVADVEVP